MTRRTTNNPAVFASATAAASFLRETEGRRKVDESLRHMTVGGGRCGGGRASLPKRVPWVEEPA